MNVIKEEAKQKCIAEFLSGLLGLVVDTKADKVVCVGLEDCLHTFKESGYHVVLGVA